MADPIAIGALTTAGVKKEFSLVYVPGYKGVVDRIGEAIWLDATSDKLTELYAFLEAAPYPVRRDPGNVIGADTILSRQFSITNRNFGRRIYLPINWQDDQTGSVWAVARALGQNWSTLPERIFYQYLTAATDNDLLPGAPNSADGSALYLTTTRYGSSSGNVVTVTGTSTVQDVITDIYQVEQRFLDFQNTKSQPFWDPTDIDRGMTIFHGTSTLLVMRQAEKQMVHAIAASTATSNAGVSNMVIADESRHKFTPSQRISNARYYCFLRGQPVEKRPMVRQVRENMFESQGNYATSDHTRDTGENYIQYESREGWGSALAIATVRVS